MGADGMDPDHFNNAQNIHTELLIYEAGITRSWLFGILMWLCVCVFSNLGKLRIIQTQALNSPSSESGKPWMRLPWTITLPK